MQGEIWPTQGQIENWKTQKLELWNLRVFLSFLMFGSIWDEKDDFS